jgi:hypothetical protein
MRGTLGGKPAGHRLDTGWTPAGHASCPYLLRWGCPTADEVVRAVRVVRNERAPGQTEERWKMKRRAAPFVLMLLIGVVLVQTGCSVGPQDLVTFAGTVQGDSLSAAQSAQNALTGIAAQVTCNGVSAQAAGDGRYSLSVPKANTYRCTATKPPAYAPESVTISGRSGASIALDFSGSHLPACHFDLVSFDVECAELHFQPGTLRGTVTYSPGGAPAAKTTVYCPNLASIAGGFAGVPDWMHVETDETGAFSLPGLSVGSYNCFAVAGKGYAAFQHVTVQPGGVISAAFQVCNAGCPPVTYHLGRVMHTYSAYLIFWQPGGWTFEPGGSDATYKSLIERYFHDIGGTPFFGLLTQYWDYQGPVQNVAGYGGAYVDTTPYEHCVDVTAVSCRPAAATKSDPLLDNDIRAEVSRALKKNPSWHAGDTSEFVVLTGYGAEECYNSTPQSPCTWKQDNGFCGYHNSFFPTIASPPGPPSIYAYIPDHANDGGGCDFTQGFVTPNHDSLADATINTISHEQFESVTNPLPEDAPGWYDDSTQAQRDFATEIGDKCVRDLGNVGNDGGNITLANGHRYLLQWEYSNLAKGCAQS